MISCQMVQLKIIFLLWSHFLENNHRRRVIDNSLPSEEWNLIVWCYVGNTTIQRQNEVSLNSRFIDGRGLPNENIVPSNSNSNNGLARGNHVVTALEFLSGNKEELDAKDEEKDEDEEKAAEETFKSPPALQSFTCRFEHAESHYTNDVRERD